MTEAAVDVQEKIFHDPLNSSEIEEINALVNKHKNNSALTQQLAMDASRIVAASQDRLEEQMNSGFFKRLACAISGKTSESQLLNQIDMIHVQKFAWHYLQQLQEQNLISAQSIAVIRNNLGEMNKYIIETRDFLEIALDKINRRLEHVENHASFNSWLVNVDANKRRFKSIPRALLVLDLTYDFMRSHNAVALTHRDINFLIVTLEKLGINCDEDVELLDFIVEIIDQIEISGIDRYQRAISLSFDQYHIDSEFVQKNISGVGFNALYFLSDQYEKVSELIGDEDICNSDEVRRKIISKFFGKEFSGLNVRYSWRDLIFELVGASLVTIEIYKDFNGLNPSLNEDEIAEDAYVENVSLVSSLPDVSAHSILDNIECEEDRRDYLLLFSLCLENSSVLSKEGRDFLQLLSEIAGIPHVISEIFNLADNKNKNDCLSDIRVILGDSNKAFTWLIDAFFLMSLCHKKDENPEMARICGILKLNNFKEFIKNIRVVINDNDETNIISAIEKLALFSDGWKNIIRYRALRFDGFYGDIFNQLSALDIEIDAFRDEMSMLISRAGDCNYVFFEDRSDIFGFNVMHKIGAAVDNVAYLAGRKWCCLRINQMRKRVSDFVGQNSSIIHRVNREMGRWNLELIKFRNSIDFRDFDMDSSLDNDDWYADFVYCANQINDTLFEFSGSCSYAMRQIGYFRSGEFDKSAIEIKAKEIENRLNEEWKERVEKQSISIDLDGIENYFSIKWMKVENPPCDPEFIRDIKTDGKVWLIVDREDCLFRSEDGDVWLSVKIEDSYKNFCLRDLSIVNGLWVLMSTKCDQGFYYSTDAIEWRQTQFPDISRSFGSFSTKDLVYFNGLWIWRFEEKRKYSYIEKGLFFDSEKISSYSQTIFFCSESLEDQWQLWDAAPNLSEGEEVVNIYSLPGVECLLAFCQYDSSYVDKKRKISAAPSVLYYSPVKHWRTCSWPMETTGEIVWGGSNGDGVSFASMGGRLISFCHNFILSSDKGFEWKIDSRESNVANFFHLRNFSIFSSRRDSGRIYVSQDAEVFKDVVLGEGRWKYFSANEEGVLSVHSPNDHEAYLMVGHYNCQSQERRG